MKSYLSLVPISAKVHRRQSRMTRICIILAVFLVTSIFSMAEMMGGLETTAMRRKHGDWHIAIQNLSEKEAEQIRSNPDIAFSSWCGTLNMDGEQGYAVNGKNVALYGVEETYVTDIMKYPSEGSWPENEREAALSKDAKELFGAEIGSSITLHTSAGDFSYTVTGFYEDDEELNDIIGGCCVYLDRAAFEEVLSRNGAEQPMQLCYIRFENEKGLDETIADMKEQYHLASENVIENTGVLGMLGGSGSESFNGFYQLAAVCFVIILIAGILMISSCMNSNVAQRTRFFGMMRCIGASEQQIIRFVRLEALNWCKTAIPIGCILGMVTCWILSAALRFFVKGEWVDMPLFSVSITGILCGAVVGVITVFIAAHSPAKQAAKVSPVAAVSGNAEVSQNVGHAAGMRFFKVETSLGIRHAAGSKKNLCLMTGSFALTIVLFLAFSACLDLVNKLIPSASNFTPDMTIASEDGTNAIDRSLVEEISEIPGVESAFGMMMAVDAPVEINGSAGTIDLFSHGDFIMDRFKNSIISGDVSKVYGDSGYAMAVYNEAGHLDVGDKIKIGNQEIEVACVASEGVGSISGAPVVACSEETYRRVTGEQGYATVSVITKNNISESEAGQIRELADGYQFLDNREENSDISGSYWVFRIAAYGFLAIIFLITVLNIMNSISMSVTARTRQYGAMRAVGMETRQVTKMIAAEAAAYAISGMAAGIVLGLLLHYLIYVKVILTHFGGSWHIPWTTIGIVFLLVAFSCAAAVHGPSKRMRSMAITDTINDL